MMSRYFDSGRVYRPRNGVSVGIYDEQARILVIQKLRLEGDCEEGGEDHRDIGLLFESREGAVEYFEEALRACKT